MLAVFLMGMAKGGFPVGALALQMIVLLWPGKEDPARSAIGFMLPMLCAMDICAVSIYRKNINWTAIKPLFLWSALGVAIATPVFLAKGTAITVPDRFIKLCIGVVGLSFVVYQGMRGRILRKLESMGTDSTLTKASVGLLAGFISSVAHAAGPIIQMYLLPKRQPKKEFVATMAAFFFVLNYVKLVPFVATGTISSNQIRPMLICLPLIPFGVILGYFAVRLIPQKAYVILIYTTLFLTSVRLIVKVIL
jgi:uncharacterized membrane protein YfcA